MVIKSYLVEFVVLEAEGIKTVSGGMIVARIRAKASSSGMISTRAKASSSGMTSTKSKASSSGMMVARTRAKAISSGTISATEAKASTRVLTIS